MVLYTKALKQMAVLKACCRAKGRIASVKEFDFKDAEGTTLVDAWNWKN